MERIKLALKRSYEVDHIAFYFEMIGFIFTVAASLIMAVTAKNPNMLIVYPLFLVGSSTGLYAYYRREMVWTIALTGYFVVINIVGFTVALV
jgi:hypothetical protein